MWSRQAYLDNQMAEAEQRAREAQLASGRPLPEPQGRSGALALATGSGDGEKVTVWCVSMGGNSCVHDSLESALNDLRQLAEEGIPGDEYTLTVKEMTKANLESLGDFAGW